jgi:hypothetical protein
LITITLRSYIFWKAVQDIEVTADLVRAPGVGSLLYPIPYYRIIWLKKGFGLVEGLEMPDNTLRSGRMDRAKVFLPTKYPT